MKFSVYIASLALLMSSCSQNEQPVKNQQQNPAPTPELTTNLVVATGRIEPDKEIVTLSASEGGIVKTVLKKEGSAVSAGEVLIELEKDLEESRINEIKATIGTQLKQIEIEKNHIAEVQTNLNYKLQLLEKAKKLVAKGAETQQVADDLNTEVELLRIRITEARMKAELADNNIRELNSKLNTATIELRRKQFIAPSGGLLLKMNAKQGGAVSKYETYAEFAPTGEYIIRAEVDELFAEKVKSGQQVDVLNASSITPIAVGEIYFVSPYLKKKSLFSEKTDEQEDRRVREIKIRLKTNKDLLINSKVECKIKI